MPRYTPEVAEAKAKNLIKPYIRNGLNQSALAKELGVTSEAINQRLKRKPVQDALRRYIDSPKLKAKLIKVAEEGLSANKVISCNVIANDGEGMKDANSMTKDFIDVPDHQSRHRFWHDLVTAAGVLKINDNGQGNNVIIIKINSSNSFVTPEEQEVISGKKDSSRL